MTDYRLIEMFGVCVKSENVLDTDQARMELQVRAAKLGYVIHPDICNSSIKSFLDNQEMNPNSTFYKHWTSVTNDLQRYIDQFTHYMCAYLLDQTYTPEELTSVPEYSSYKVIMPVTIEEMFIKCRDMLCSGIALKRDTVNVLCDFITKSVKEEGLLHMLDIDSVKNKEAFVILCNSLGVTPTDKFALLRYLVYQATGSSEMINSKTFNNLINLGAHKVDMSKLSQEQLKSLASLFYRYKYVFMGLRVNLDNRPIINKIRRMAERYHVPMKVGLWERVVSEECDLDEVKNRLNEIDNFKLVRLLQAINENLRLQSDGGDKMYIIRNGSCFIKKSDYKQSITRNTMFNYWKALYEVLYEGLLNNIVTKRTNEYGDKKVYVKFDKYLNLACPTSEKNFIGNIPFGSYYDMVSQNIVGIYWRNEWGTHDFDLSFMDYTGCKIGWNGDWKRYSFGYEVSFSGDMVTADPEATELLLFGNKKRNKKLAGVIYVNRFNGDPNSKFKFLIAQDNTCTYVEKNYMVDPNKIQVSTMIESEKEEQMIGFIQDSKLYLCNINYKNARVSSADANELLSGIFKRKADSFVNLKNVLISAGYEEMNEGGTPEEDVEILDLTDLNKDTLIKLFS